MNKKITILVATHKPYPMPKDDMYLPIFVGAKGKEDIDLRKPFARDDSGKNISEKNPYYCELTALYWGINNLKSDYIGLVHYRRHFCARKRGTTEAEKIAHVLKQKEAEELLKKADIILPKLRRYHIETVYNHYVHTLYSEPIQETRKIIAEKYPDYLKEFDRLRKRTSAHMFNMCIMERKILKNYCAWLFDILSELEKRVDADKYTDFHKRFYGRISEVLLDVYINKNGLKYVEAPTMDVQRVNWFHKGRSFLAAKYRGKKYDKSF